MLKTNSPTGLHEVLAAHAAKIWIMENQVAELRALLDEVHLGQSGNLIVEAVKTDEFAQSYPRIIETERLVEVAGQKIVLGHVLVLPIFSSYTHTLTAFGVVIPTNYFNGFYSCKA